MLNIDRSDLEQMEKRFRTNFVNSLSGYKSANLLGTIDSAGRTNLAMISSVFHVGAQPPLIGFLMRPHTVPRHSLENILEIGCFTINHVHSGIYAQAHQTAARYAKEESEFDATGLHEAYRASCQAPFVAEAHLGIELMLADHVHVALNKTELIIGEIQRVYLEHDCIEDDGYIDINSLDTVSVSGLDSYHRCNPIERLPYPKPERGSAVEA